MVKFVIGWAQIRFALVKFLQCLKKHGIVGKISSDALTDDIITDLKTVMAGEE